MTTTDKHIVIAGGSGLIGTELANLLRKNELSVSILTRDEKLAKKPVYIYWNPSKGEIDIEALKSANILINFSGSNINTRWTSKAKKQIVESRVTPVKFLVDCCTKNNITLSQIICASAVGIYPQKRTAHKHYTEKGQTGDGFLSKTVIKWEDANTLFEQVGPLIQLRIGLVLANNGGAFPLLKKITQYGLASTIGTGKQGYSWIHIDDLAKLILYVIEKNLFGTYNAVAPNPVNQKQFMKALASELNKPKILPPAPSWLLKLLLGERAMLITKGAYVSSKKIIDEGFSFQFPTLPSALKHLIHENA